MHVLMWRVYLHARACVQQQQQQQPIADAPELLLAVVESLKQQPLNVTQQALLLLPAKEKRGHSHEGETDEKESEGRGGQARRERPW